MNFPQFAFHNVRRNSRAYIAYFLSSAFMVMIFFSYAVFLYHPDVAVSELGKMSQTGIRIAEYIIFVFSFLFVLYSISVFLKARNREFGLLTILGASSSQLNRLIFLENMIIGAASIFTGMAAGLLLNKLFLLFSSRFIGLGEMPFYWPGKAVLLTSGAFLALFLFLSVFTLMFIRKSRVLELLTGTSRPKKEPRASILLSLLTILLLGTALYLLYKGGFSPEAVLAAAVLGITGTYFFYTQLSVLVFRLLRKNRRQFWKRTNLLWISEFAYKLKDNARMLFMVTVAISIACMSIGLVLSTRHENEQLYKNNPFALTFVEYSPNKETAAELDEIDSFFVKENIPFEKATVKSFTYQIKTTDNYRYVEFMSRSDFEKLYALLPASRTEPAPPEPSGGWTTEKGLSIKGSNNGELNTSRVELKDLSLTLQLDEASMKRLGGNLSMTNTLIVEDSVFTKLVDLREKDRLRIAPVTKYRVPAWDNLGYPDGDNPEAAFNKKLMDHWQEKKMNPDSYLRMRADNYRWVKESTSMIGFICFFISAIFSVSSASFLYFKLFAELARDGQNYRSLSRIGLSVREMKRSVTTQIALLFFLPTAISTIQTFVVLRPILKTMDIPLSLPPVLTASIFFAAAQLLYFLVVRSRYVHHLARRMERI